MRTRRWLAMILCMCIVVCLGVSSPSPGVVELISDPRLVLAEMSNDDSIAFLESYGVEIPYTLVDAGGTAVKDVVMEYLNDPNTMHIVGNAVVSNFYHGVQRAVKKYTSYTNRPKPYAETMYGL